jgi:D-alanyl-lipoteichoic acid acyltransferase DltB (MBOAT superfamily)
VLFNSYPFIFLFLPITLWVFFRLGRTSPGLAAGWLAAASLFFYGWWNPAYVGLLLASIVFNFFVSRQIAFAVEYRKAWLAFAVTANLALLSYYKYANFFIATANQVTATNWSLGEIILPLGISFFTFTQIAFLVDTYYGYVKEYRFVHYVLFVTYFPHLIAGPVLHHKEMMPQFEKSETYRPRMENMAVGVTIFIFGLFKKVILADGIAPYTSQAFAATTPPSFFDAWGGVLAYTFQLYFDFSGYSDMAIGLSRLFGIRLPLNFDSPYKAVSIVDFWRRWHMTLSRFLRDYLYIPLGGNRHGRLIRYRNLMLTMLLGGLWHGAGWTYVLWGGLHGLYLVVNNGWERLREACLPALPIKARWYRFVAIALTFLCVVIAWVFFRSPNLNAALNILYAMGGGNGVSIPASLSRHLGSLELWLAAHGVTVALGGGSRFLFTWSWVLALAAIAFLLPNTQEFLAHFSPALDSRPEPSSPLTEKTSSLRLARMAWQPTAVWACLVGVMGGACLLSLTRVSEFLYFQF